MSTRLSVGIVGGGIGGMTAALDMLQRGFDVHVYVYEQAREFAEVGAGIQVGPDASRVLHGLEDALAGMGVRPLAWHQRRWDDGRTLLYTPLRDAMVKAFGFPFYQMHRADLLATLVREAIEDGVALTTCLAETADVPAALRRYEAVGLPRASKIQALSAQNKIRFHLPDGLEQEERDRQMATAATDFSANAVAWIYGHDAGIVEDAPV